MKKFISKEPFEAIQFTPDNYKNTGTEEIPKYEFEGIPVRGISAKGISEADADGYFITCLIAGSEVIINSGDWLLKDADSKLKIVHKDEHFQDKFKEVVEASSDIPEVIEEPLVIPE
jgi:hypothetical protein